MCYLKTIKLNLLPSQVVSVHNKKIFHCKASTFFRYPICICKLYVLYFSHHSYTQGPHERLLPLRNWTEKRFIFSNTGVHSGDKSGNRISRNVWPFEKLRVENWQICLNTTGRIFIILPRLMVILPALFDFSRPWRFISAQKSYWTLHFCHTLMLLEEK